MKRTGAVFKHGKGNGFNVVINGNRYATFPPKAKTTAVCVNNFETLRNEVY